MDVQQILMLVFRWIHVIPAMILVGGTIFLRCSLVPAANEVGGSNEVREAIRRRWAKLVMLSVLLLLVSGIYNFHLKAVNYKMDGTYLVLMAIKVLLALAVFYLVAVVSGRSNTARRFREKEIFWLNVLCVAMIGIVCIAGYVKVFPIPAKVEPVEQARLIVDSCEDARLNNWLGKDSHKVAKTRG